MPKKAIPKLVPDGLMIPLGADATARWGQCADSWNDSQKAELRALLPPEYHGVPLDWLGARWINIRKKGTPGYRVNGKGPAKKSRKKAKRPRPPKWYSSVYLQSDHWQAFRPTVVEFWEGRCALCYVSDDEALCDVHHRTYDRLWKEKLSDCIYLCRRCHTEFHNVVPPQKMPQI